MYVQSLGITLATATVHSETEVIDVTEVFGEEVSEAILEAALAGYSNLDEMVDEKHCYRLVRLHLAECRWEIAQRNSDVRRDLETLSYPLTFKPAPRRALN